MTKLLETPMSRRNVLQAATAGALTIAPRVACRGVCPRFRQA